MPLEFEMQLLADYIDKLREEAEVRRGLQRPGELTFHHGEVADVLSRIVDDLSNLIPKIGSQQVAEGDASA